MSRKLDMIIYLCTITIYERLTPNRKISKENENRNKNTIKLYRSSHRRVVNITIYKLSVFNSNMTH